MQRKRILSSITAARRGQPWYVCVLNTQDGSPEHPAKLFAKEGAPGG